MIAFRYIIIHSIIGFLILDNTTALFQEQSYSLQDERIYLPCSKQVANIQIQGTDIFNSLQGSLDRILITGWVYIRGYSNTDYTIVSIHEKIGFTYVFIIGLSYNPINKKFKLNLANVKSVEEDDPFMGSNTWFFVLVYLTKSQIDSSNIQLNVSSKIFRTASTINIVPLDSILSSIQFDTQKMKINIGQPHMNMMVNPSCSVIKQFKLTWNILLSNINLFDYIDNPSSNSNELLYYYDFKSYLYNLGYIYSIAGDQDKLDLPQKNQDPSILYSNQFIQTDLINFQSQGFTLSFYFKLLEDPTSENQILRIDSLFAVSLQINVLQNKILEFIFEELSFPQQILLFQEIYKNDWVHVILILQQDFKTHFNLFVKTSFIEKMTSFQYQTQQLNTGILTFASNNNHNSMQLANILLYKSSQISKTSTCKFMIYTKTGKQCIRCEDSHLLDTQNNNQCVLKQSNTDSITGIMDWNPPHIQCPENMIQQTNTLNCVCRKSFFLKSGKCERCPKYWSDCLSESQPIKSRLGRMQINCAATEFDNGLQCLLNDGYKIPLKNNIVDKFEILNGIADPNYDPTCNQSTSREKYIINNEKMQLNNDDSFFYSFSMKFSQNTQTSILSYFENNGVILFTIKYQQISSQDQIIFCNKNDFQLFAFSVNKNEGFWIGIWMGVQSGNFKVHFSVYSNSKFYSQPISIGASQSYVDPKICIGPCKTIVYPYFCGVFLPQPFIFIKKFIFFQSINNKQQLADLQQQQAQLIAYFIYLPNAPSSSFIALNQLDESSQYLFNFIQGSKHQNIKGFALNENFQGEIKDLNNSYSHPHTFTCSIFIENIQKQILFMKQQINGHSITISFFPKEFIDSSFIRICYGNDCQDTQNCMLDHNKVNFLMVLFRNKSPFSTDIFFYEFEIVCNQFREILGFMVQITNQINSNTLQIGSALNSQPFQVYFNYLKLYLGDGYFYFSQDPNDKCFIYINLKDMTCIQPKNGNVLYGNDLITTSECIAMSIQGNTIYSINEYSKECVNTQISNKYCKEYDLMNNKCTKCNYPDELCEVCIDGYYFDLSTKLCVLCQNQCLKCKNTASNCTACRYSFSKTVPSCECHSFQYLSNYNICKLCSPQCSRCENSADNCTSCAAKRQNIPTCDCNNQFYQKNTKKCDPIICNEICQTCEYEPSRCVQCKKGRVNPPFCECETNYYPSLNGECSPCELNEYYDDKLQSCQLCQQPCQTCEKFSKNCLTCHENTVYLQNKCICEKGSLGLNQKGQLQCVETMEVVLKVNLIDNFYILEFTFDYDLKQIDFKNEKDNQIIQIYFSQIPQNHYYLTDFQITRNQLFAKLVINESFQATEGSVYIPQTQLFTSISERYSLNQTYQYRPINFKIGPFLFSDKYIATSGVDEALNKVKNTNEDLISFTQQFQLLFYFLNTIQPTSMILFLNAQLPPNLYKFCQLFGLFVFPYVSNYQTQEIKQTYSLFWYELDSFDIGPTESALFRKLGFSFSFLINTQMILLKQFVFLLLLGITKILKMIKSVSIPTTQQYKKLKEVKITMLNKLLSEIEMSLLLLGLSILLQFSQISQDIWTCRYGTYFAIFEVVFISYQIRNVYSILRNNQLEQYQRIEIFTSRQNNNDIQSKFYFFIQMIKKYAVILLLFFGQNYPIVITISISLIFFFSSILTYCCKPYQVLRTRIIKIVGELLLAITWILLLIIVKMERDMSHEIVFPNSLIDKYLKIGFAIIIFLSIFNILFLIEFLCQIIEKILELIHSKKNNTRNTNRF